MRVRSIAGAVLGGALLLPSGVAHAAAAWGDATLRSADRRLVVDKDGVAEVVEDVGLHVTAKHFRSFLVEGVEEGAVAPSDPATVNGMDGLGWPIGVTDAKGNLFPAFAEPTKEARQLRLRLGDGGLPRGEFTVHLRYKLDLVRSHRLVRDGAALRLSVAAPRWPEGYDNGKVVVVLPAGNGEPRVTVADVGEAEHAVDGLALVSVKREGAFDTLTIVRPHVPPHDDTRFLVRVDPQAFPVLAAATGAADVDSRPLVGKGGKTRPIAFAVGAGLLGLALAFALRARDRALAAAAAALDLGAPRPLVPWLSDNTRAAAYGLTVAAAAAATALLPAPTAVPCLVGALALAVVRPPPTSAPAQGRWLRVPRVPTPKLPAMSLLDPSGVAGAVAGVATLVAAVAAVVLLAPQHPRLALALAMNGVVLAPLFLTGRRSQLLPCSTPGALRILSSLARDGQLVLRAGARGPADVRIRLVPSAEAVARGFVAAEVGCGSREGFAGVELHLELLLRAEAGSVADRALSVFAEAHDAVRTLGRDPTESVTSVRLSSSAREAVLAVLGAAEAAVVAGDTPAPSERRRTPRSLIAPAVGFGPSHS